MKKETGFLISLIIVLLTYCQVSARYAWFDDIVIIPGQPSYSDVITFDISGFASRSDSSIVSSIFQKEENGLTLDLTIDMGLAMAVSIWSYSEQIGTLNPGTYSATVRLFYPYDPTGEELQDTYVTDFTVTPEPATLTIFAMGTLVLFRKRHRSIKNHQ